MRFETKLTFLVGLVAAGLLMNQPCALSQQKTAPGQAGRFRIAGKVVSSASDMPLNRARVFISNVTNRQVLQSLLTEEDGAFEFSGLAAGKYSLEGAKNGFISAAYDQHEQYSTAIVTGAGVDTEHLRLRLPPAAALSGTIVDEAGEQVREARVTLYRQTHTTGLARIAPYRAAVTDDRGSYEFAPLPAGTYFIGVAASPWYATPRLRGGAGDPAAERPLDVAYPVTYYADATESSDATPILVRNGDNLEIDVHLTPVPALHLVFRSGDGATEERPILQKKVFDETEELNFTFSNANEGAVELGGIAPGRYTLQLQGAAGVKNLGEIDLENDGQEVDGSGGEQQAEISAVVRLPGEKKIPEQIMLGLSDPQGRNVMFSRVDDQGRATFSSVKPGAYSLLAPSRGKLYAVSKIVSAGEAMAGNRIVVNPGESLKISVTLVSGAATVEGVARTTGGPAPGALILLVPKNPASNYQLFRRDQSDLDGSFTFRDVIPGSYTAIAIQDGWDLEWSSAAVLTRYLKRGVPLKVDGSTKGTIKLRQPVELQPR